MFENIGSVVNHSENILPASTEHTERSEEQNQDGVQQIRTRVKHLNGTEAQMDGNMAHKNTSATRNETYRQDHDPDQDNLQVTSRRRLDDSIFLNQKNAIDQDSYALAGIANRQNHVPDTGRRHSLFETIPDDQVDENAALTTMQRLQGRTCARVSGIRDHPPPQSNTHADIENPSSIHNHSNTSPTIPAALQDQVNPVFGASDELTAPPFHQAPHDQIIHPRAQADESNSSPVVATLRNHAYALAKSPVDAMKKELNSDRHELVSRVPEVRGSVQTECYGGSSTEFARDVGWYDSDMDLHDPLIGGYTNGELFGFLRRFNKDVFDVKALAFENTSGLDLNDAWGQDHTGDKLSLHLQRLYLSVVLGIASLGKQVSRLRSWKEFYRTSILCGIYFTAWILDLLVPFALGISILVVSSVQARNIIFPPAPRALVNMRTGGIQKPPAGLLGTSDTLTGAPEKQTHEAIEEEAANFVDNVRHNIQRALGMHNSQQKDGDGDPLEGKVPKPIKKVIQAVQSAGSAPGHVIESTDQTQQPMEEIIWAQANPEVICNNFDIAIHLIGELADNWEIFANAISPTPPFSRFSFLRIVAILVPSLLLSLFVNSYMVYKGTGLIIGFVIFGDPMLTSGIAWLKRNIPNYMELVQPRNNVLHGIPTNNQIAITLLRIGEACKTPLPPVPSSKPDDFDHQNAISVESIPVGTTQSDVLDAATPSVVEKTYGDDNEEKPDHKHLSKIIRFFKGNAKSVVKTKLVIDHIRAATGSQKAKGHLGVLPDPKSIVYAGPSIYQGRYEGIHGWAIIKCCARPSLLFTRDDPRPMSSKKLTPLFEIAIRDMKRLKRATAFVSSTVEAIATSSSDQKLLASLEIEDKEEKTWRLTAIPERDELFNRLIAIGNQRWENM